MRGLIFTGGLQPDIHKARHLLTPFSFVVVADSGLCAAEKAGIVPDIIVGDMDSIPDLSILKKYPAEKIQRWPKDKDYTDTELAMMIMDEKGISQVTLVGGSGGRLDHFFALKDLFETNNRLSMWICEESVVISAENSSENDQIIISGLADEDAISVFPAGRESHTCITKGLYWPIDNLKWDEGKFSLSNRTNSGTLFFKAVSGRFLIVVPLHSLVRIERTNEDFLLP